MTKFINLQNRDQEKRVGGCHLKKVEGGWSEGGCFKESWLNVSCEERRLGDGWTPKIGFNITGEIFVSISRITQEVLTKDTNPDIVVIFRYAGSVGIQCP